MRSSRGTQEHGLAIYESTHVRAVADRADGSVPRTVTRIFSTGCRNVHEHCCSYEHSFAADTAGQAKPSVRSCHAHRDQSMYAGAHHRDPDSPSKVADRQRRTARSGRDYYVQGLRQCHRAGLCGTRNSAAEWRVYVAGAHQCVRVRGRRQRCTDCHRSRTTAGSNRSVDLGSSEPKDGYSADPA